MSCPPPEVFEDDSIQTTSILETASNEEEQVPLSARKTSLNIPTLPEAWPESIVLRDVLIQRKVDNSWVRSARATSILPSLQNPAFLDNSRLQRLVLHPQRVVRVCFDILSIVLLAVDLTLIPVMLAWDLSIEGPLLGFSLCTSVFWAFDICMNFVSGYYLDGGEVEMRPRRIAQHYVRGWFVMDCAIVLCDWLSLMSVLTEGTVGTSDVFALIRFAKMSRLFRAFALLRMFRLARITDELLDKLFYHEIRIATRVVMILMLVMWVNHLISCTWYAVGRYSQSDTGTRWTKSGVSVGNVSYVYEEQIGVYQYASSLHWSIAQMTLGAIDITASNTAERAFNIFMLLLGLLFSSTLVSTLSATMVDLRMRVDKQSKQLRVLRLFLRQNEVALPVQHRVLQQAAYRIKQRERLTEGDVSALNYVSSSLRAEVRFQMFKDHLGAHPLLNVASSINLPTTRDICANAVDFHYLQGGDDLFSVASWCICAYYIVTGSVTYIQEPETSPVSQQEATRIVGGTWLCEAALWTNWVHVGSAYANDPSQVMEVDSERLVKSLRKHRLIDTLMQAYAHIFHDHLTKAKPPEANWPSDVSIDNTDFGDIVILMDSHLQTRVSMEALGKLSRPGMFRIFSDTDRIKKQIQEGDCILWVNQQGRFERVVRVMVFHVTRAVDDSCLVQVGNIESGSTVVPTVQFPGGKMKSDEEVFAAMERLLSERLEPLVNSIEVLGFHQESATEDSPSLHIRTKYLKTVCNMRMKSSLYGETCVLKQQSQSKKSFSLPMNLRTTSNTSAPCDPPYRESPADFDRECFQFRRGESDRKDRQEVDRPVVHRMGGELRSGLYSWMTKDEMLRLQRHDKEDVFDWLASLEIPERVRNRKISTAGRSSFLMSTTPSTRQLSVPKGR